MHTFPDDALGSHHRPRVGDVHELEPMNMHPFSVVVTMVAPMAVELAQVFPGESVEEAVARNYPRVVMPPASARHFVNDLRGLVVEPESGDPAVDAVLAGDAGFLGKGDDGLAFRVGDEVVKVSTTVPYQPFNLGHLSPEASIVRAEEQRATAEAMARDVPGILPSRLVVSGEKAFTVKPYVEIPKRFTEAELAEVARSVELAHDAGWVFGDELQIGLLDGHVVHFDTGKAHESTTHAKRDDFHSEESLDISALKRFFRDHGGTYLTAREKADPSDEMMDIELMNPGKMTEEERKKVRSRLVRLDFELVAYAKNFPNASIWTPEEAKDAVRKQLKRFRDLSCALTVTRGRRSHSPRRPRGPAVPARASAPRRPRPYPWSRDRALPASCRLTRSRQTPRARERSTT